MQGGPVPRAGGNLRSTSETWSGHRSFRRWRSTLLRLKGSRRTGLCLLYAFFFSLFVVIFDSLSVHAAFLLQALSGLIFAPAALRASLLISALPLNYFFQAKELA